MFLSTVCLLVWLLVVFLFWCTICWFAVHVSMTHRVHVDCTCCSPWIHFVINLEKNKISLSISSTHVSRVDETRCRKNNQRQRLSCCRHLLFLFLLVLCLFFFPMGHCFIVDTTRRSSKTLQPNYQNSQPRRSPLIYFPSPTKSLDARQFSFYLHNVKRHAWLAVITPLDLF